MRSMGPGALAKAAAKAAANVTTEVTAKSALLACVALIAIASPSAPAQTYPTQPIKIVAPVPPGGGADYPLFRYERLVGDWRNLGYDEAILERVFFRNAEALFGQPGSDEGN